MRIRKQTLAILLAIIAIVALVWLSKGIREGFTQVAVISMSDVSAQAANQPGSAALQQLTSWVNTNAPNVKNIPSWAMYFYMFGTQYSGISTPPSFDDFFDIYAKGWVAYGESGVTGDYLKSIYTGGDTTIANAIYQYYFGTSMPTPPSTTPSPISAKTTPSPASSSSTQPMTVGVPSPCRSSYKSIPGGSMEFKCFN